MHTLCPKCKYHAIIELEHLPGTSAHQGSTSRSNLVPVLEQDPTILQGTFSQLEPTCMHTRPIAPFLYLCSMAALAMGAATDGAAQPLATIETLDVPRYMGTWYEITKFPNWFQKKCVGNTKAEYSLETGGKVTVINRCKLEDGDISEAIGRARQVGTATSPKLEVRFAPSWLSFIPAVWGDYWVIDLDSEYKLVAISEPTRQYLWVLSRTPKVNKASYDALLDRLGKKGFDLRNLEATPQKD